MTARTLLAALLIGAAPALADDLSTPTLGDDSAYTLTKVDAAGDNTITKFEYNSTTGEFTPVYYRVDLKQTEYGEPQGDVTLSFGWEDKNYNWNDNRTEFLPNPTNPIGQTITYKYNSSDLLNNKIYNVDGIDYDINGNFINLTDAAIENLTVMQNIHSDFIGNSVINSQTNQGASYGAAINNLPAGEIGDITGDFIGNYVQSDTSTAAGGAIYNTGSSHISSITGNFVGNHAIGKEAHGGAIYNMNYGHIENNINANFIGNYTFSEDGNASGGAITNYGHISGINGDFIKNYVTGATSAYGGAIYNSSDANGSMGTITGDFIGNYVSSEDGAAYGGAIYNNHTGEYSINGDFIGNHAYGTNVYGGAIYNNENTGTIKEISGDFIGNYVDTSYYGEEASGGAIYNNSTIDTISGNFYGNYVNNDSSSRYQGNSYGGAIYNTGIINHITGNFYNNYAFNDSTTRTSFGGAIYNSGTINNGIHVDFIENHTYEFRKTEQGGYGGAIYNAGTINGDISGNYIKNSAASGAAIYNEGTINGDISGNFTDNSGGAIHNEGTINGDISGNFLNNISNYDSTAAIYNTGTITGNITGTFINNTGYAIYNGGILNNISGDFNKNEIGVYLIYASGANSISGNFIENAIAIETDWSAKINNIIGHFENNGTAIDYGAEYGTDTISGDFINNSNSAIIYTTAFATGNIENIKGNFIGNHSDSSGGALYTGYGAYIKNLISDFKDNYVSSTSNSVSGGAIANILEQFNQGINTITGTFQNNYAYTSNGNAYGGAIYNSNILGDHNPSDSGMVISEDSTADSFVLYMDVRNFKNTSTGEIKTLYSYDDDVDVIKENLANGYKIIFRTLNEGSQDVDAENWDALLENLQQDIDSGVYTELHPYEKFNLSEEDLATGQGIIGSTFIGNYAQSDNGDAVGGAIYNSGTIGLKNNGYFTGGAYNYGPIGLKNNGDFTGGIINSSFYNNYAKSENGTAKGGAIYTANDLNIIAKDGGASIFSGNYTETNGVKRPNAIYVNTSAATTPVTQVVSINTQNVTTEQKYGILAPTLSLNANSNGIIQFDDTIDGNIVSTNIITTTSDLVVDEDYKDYSKLSTVEEVLEALKKNPPYWADENTTDENFLSYLFNDGILVATNEQTETKTEITAYSLNITGDETGKVILNNDVTAHTYDADGKETGTAPVNISLEKTNLYLGARDDVFNGNNLDLKSGSMSMVNDAAGVSALNSLTVSGDTNFVADVDLAAKEMDRFTASEYGSHTGNLNVVGMNLLSDANMDEDVTAVYFAEPGLKNNVVNAVGELPGAYQTAYTPIYKYNFIYDTENEYDGKGDGGYFVFTRGDKIPVLPDPDEPDKPVTPGGGGGSTGNQSDAFNPAVLATPVGNLAAGQAAVNEAFKYVFEHADAFTQLPAMERYAKINANKYALSTDFNDNMPEYFDQLHNNAVWFRPYTTFESMNLDNGPDVDAITYGSLVGFDGDFKEMQNGWHRVFTGYAGYMGSSLNYSGVDTTMNGGLLGFTETFYKGNFWTAITASAGASVGESHSMYGKEDYTSLLAGVGSKTGYNFEFKDGKFIIQPIMYRLCICLILS